jgi:hypothetical protein
MKNNVNQIALHIVCSLAFLLFPILASPDFPNVHTTLTNPNGITEVITHFLLLVFFYLCYFLLIPQFYFKQKYVLFAGTVVAYALAMIFCLRLAYCYFPYKRHFRGYRDGALAGMNMMPDRPFNMPQQGDSNAHFQHQDFGGNHSFNGQHNSADTGMYFQHGRPPDHGFDMRRGGPPHFNILRDIFFDYNMYLLLIVLFIAMLLKTSQRWRQLQNEKLETELSYLKAQINPHFLFNTLNSIYSLAIEKSDYTATAVVKLSGMMRYIISESNKHFVSLQKEINYIKDYIELQKFRLGGTVQINYLTEGNAEGLEIAPLLLITFVENAFKYGVNPEEYSDIFIEIKIAENNLELTVSNNKVKHSLNKKESSGLGITNTKHRLEMLYPGRYTLDIQDGAKMFIVELKINLK